MVAKNEGVTAIANVLKGMDAIERFSGFNRVILMRIKKEFPVMPMNKRGGIYMADPERLSRFLRDYAAGYTAGYVDSKANGEAGASSR
jgi:hypothetical protein